MKQFKADISKLLMGMSAGLVVALIPVAILGELAKLVDSSLLIGIVSISQSLMSVAMGVSIAKQFELDPIESTSLVIAISLGSGSFKFVDGTIVLSGAGDIINAGLIALVSIYAMRLVGSKFKAYKILIVPLLTIVGCGLIGIMSLPYVSQITVVLANAVNWISNLNVLLACILMSVSFAFLIVSPASTAAIAIMVGLSGTVSGAANLGICAAAFTLGLASYKSSGLGIVSAHILASPKIQLPNFVANPKIIIPTLFNALVCGFVAYFLNISGTPHSAGFGLSGLIGPLAHLGSVGYTLSNILITLFAFVLIPLLLAYGFNFIFINKYSLLNSDDFKIDA